MEHQLERMRALADREKLNPEINYWNRVVLQKCPLLLPSSTTHKLHSTPFEPDSHILKESHSL